MSKFTYLEFFSAIANGDEEVVSRFIRNHPERWKEAAKDVRFSLSTFNHQSVMISYLMQLGYSSLHFALDSKTAEFLISAGASLEAVDMVKIIQQFWYYFLLLHISGDVHLFFAPF